MPGGYQSISFGNPMKNNKYTSPKAAATVTVTLIPDPEWAARGRPDPLARQILPAPDHRQVRWIRGGDGLPRIARPDDDGPDLEEER